MTPFIKFRMANRDRGAGIRAEGSVLWLYDVIAADDDEAAWFGGISPRQFMAALDQISGPVTLRINSPGGSVFGAQAMVAAMRGRAAPITARVDALAASAASVIATEAAQLEIVQGGMLMIHKAWGVAIGNDDDMHQTADLLGKIDLQIADTYARRGGGERAAWLDMMKAETWFDAGEAVAAGLADRVVEENLQRPTARWDLSAYAAAPWQLPEPEPEPVSVAAAAAPALTDMSAARARRLAARLVAHPI